jgi:hypothetical protein
MRDILSVESALEGPAWIMDGNYAFVCHAHQDKREIDQLGVIRHLTRDAVRLVIDKAATLNVGDLPHLVHTFRGGKEWRTQIQALADRAGCVLVLWSANMKNRIRNEPGGGWICHEILTGLRNGTAFFCCIDGEPSADDICGALNDKIEGFERFSPTIKRGHIVPLARRRLDQDRDRKQIDHDMAGLAIDIYRKIQKAISGGRGQRLDQGRISRLLNLIDREEAVDRIVQGNPGIVHIVSGRNPECRRDDLIQRLKDVELPWLHQSIDAGAMNLLAWRASIVRGADSKPWVPCYVEWPVMVPRSTNRDDIEAAVRDGTATFLRRLEARVGLVGHERSEPDSIAALTKYLASRADAYLCIFGVDEQPGTALCNKEMVDRIPTLLQGLPPDKMRIILSVQQEHVKKRLFFVKRAKPSPLEEAAVRRAMLVMLGNVRRDELHNWAALAETVVDLQSNSIMDVISDIYANVAPEGGQRALSMRKLRESLHGHLSRWPTRSVLPSQEAVPQWKSAMG